jgi:hypothetical protein
VIGRVDKVSRGHTLRKLDAGLRVNSDSMYKGQALVGVEDFEEVCRGADDAEIVHDSACGDIEGNAFFIIDSRLVDRLEEARTEKASKAVALASAVFRQEGVDDKPTLADEQVGRMRVCK